MFMVTWMQMEWDMQVDACVHGGYGEIKREKRERCTGWRHTSLGGDEIVGPAKANHEV